MKNKDGNKFFSLLGKIFSVLSGIYILIQIIQALFINPYSLRVTGEISDSMLPAPTIKWFRDLSLRENKMPNEVKASFDLIYRMRYGESRLYSIQIVNTGKKEVKDLSLETPFKEGIYTIISTEGEKTASFSGRILLANVRSSSEMKVLIWAEKIYPSEIDERLILTNPEEKFPIEFATSFLGWPRRVARFLDFWGLPLAFGVLISTGLLLIQIYTNKREKPAKRPKKKKGNKREEDK